MRYRFGDSHFFRRIFEIVMMMIMMMMMMIVIKIKNKTFFLKKYIYIDIASQHNIFDSEKKTHLSQLFLVLLTRGSKTRVTDFIGS